MTGSTGWPRPGIRWTAPLGLVAPAGRVEEHQLAHPRHAVVAADDAHELRRMAGNRPGVEERVGPVRVAAVVLHLPRAVGVHVEQQAAWLCGVSVYSQRRYSTRPLFRTVGHQLWSWSKQSWRMFAPSASMR